MFGGGSNAALQAYEYVSDGKDFDIGEMFESAAMGGVLGGLMGPAGTDAVFAKSLQVIGGVETLRGVKDAIDTGDFKHLVVGAVMGGIGTFTRRTPKPDRRSRSRRVSSTRRNVSSRVGITETVEAGGGGRAVTVHGGGRGAAGAAGLSEGTSPRRAIYTIIRDDFEKVVASQRVWGKTEGSVYGMAEANAPRWKTWIDRPGADPGRVVFTGKAAEAFKRHEVWGAYSGLKRLLGQHKAGFGDLMWAPENAVRVGNTLFVSEVQLGAHASQSTAWAAARLWGRRLGIDPASTYVTYQGVKFVINAATPGDQISDQDK